MPALTAPAALTTQGRSPTAASRGSWCTLAAHTRVCRAGSTGFLWGLVGNSEPQVLPEVLMAESALEQALQELAWRGEALLHSFSRAAITKHPGLDGLKQQTRILSKF